MGEQRVGKILGIALRTGVGTPMKEVAEAIAVESGGLVGDVASAPDQGLLLMASKQWEETIRALGTVLLWHARRANILVETATLEDVIGKTIGIGGEVLVAVKTEAKPCATMDQIRPGLRAILALHCRAGVYGRVLRGGKFSVGDAVVLCD